MTKLQTAPRKSHIANTDGVPTSTTKPSGKNASQKSAVSKTTTKTAKCLTLLSCRGDASIAERQMATDWQPHSVRGVLAARVPAPLFKVDEISVAARIFVERGESERGIGRDAVPQRQATYA